MIFLMVNCPNSSIGVMLMGMILLARLEIKELVAHATQLHLLKQWSHDWNSSTDKNHHNCHLSFCWIAITWLKDVKVDGLISMLTLPKTVTWSAKTVRHTSIQLKVPNVVSISSAQVLPKSRNHMILVVVLVTLPRSRWWRNFFMAVSWTQNSKHQQFSQHTKRVWSHQMVSQLFINKL